MLTAEQKIERKKHLGSSDMAAVLGLDPWRTAYDVWLDKKGKLIDGPESAPMKAGSLLESGVLSYAEEILGPLIRTPDFKTVEGTPLATLTDALVEKTTEPVEAKTVKLFGPSDEWWGDDGTDQVPDRVIVQAHVHMMAWGKDVCHVPALIGGRGFALFVIPRSGKIVDVIGEKSRTFWELVQGDIPPVDSHASLEIVKLVRREPKKIAGVDPALVQRWLDVNRTAKDAEATADAAKADVIAALGDAEAGLCGPILGAVTFFEQTRKEFVCKASTFRVLRHKQKGL